MSVKDEQNQYLENEKGESVEFTDLEKVKNQKITVVKKNGIKQKVIKGLKIAGVFIGGSVLGYIFGSNKSNKNTDCYENSDIVEGEVIESDIE